MKKYTAEEFRRRFANHPAVRSNANHLTEATIRIARAYGVDCWRQNNTAVFDKKAGAYRAFQGRKGVADVIGILPNGRWFAAEIKAGSDRLSDDQRDFLEMIASRGGFAVVVRDVVDFEVALKNYLDN